MAGEKIGGLGLLPRLVMGIFIPILLAFALIGIILFMDVNVGKFKFLSVRGILLNSLNELGMDSSKESGDSLNQLGEKIIRQNAEAVAKQLEIHFRESKKKLPLDRLFIDDPIAREIVLQKIGETGYFTIIDTDSVMRYHPVDKFLGVNSRTMYDKLGKAFAETNETTLSGKDAGGYYQWPDPKAGGKLKPKYQWMTHVKGTNLIVVAATWIDEFSKPSKIMMEKMLRLEKLYSERYNKRMGVVIIVLAFVFIILLAVIYMFSYNVVKPIRQLSEVADKISMGELNASIDVKAGGEIGLLAASIERMQTSVRAAIERLQKRR